MFRNENKMKERILLSLCFGARFNEREQRNACRNLTNCMCMCCGVHIQMGVHYIHMGLQLRLNKDEVRATWFSISRLYGTENLYENKKRNVRFLYVFSALTSRSSLNESLEIASRALHTAVTSAQFRCSDMRTCLQRTRVPFRKAAGAELRLPFHPKLWLSRMRLRMRLRVYACVCACVCA